MFFCIHGAGHSALSFATLAREVRQFGSLFAYDLKAHGHSKKEPGTLDFSIETLQA
jgi:protein phosphatase methylesterase 1